MHYLHDIFNKFKSIFKHTDDHNLQVGSRKSNVWSNIKKLVRSFLKKTFHVFFYFELNAQFKHVAYQRWSDSGFFLSDPILFLKNDIRIRSESCFGWNHTIRILKLSEIVLWRTTYVFVLCLFRLEAILPHKAK